MAKLKKAIITLVTDFGLDNWFVGTMKGVIKSINAHAEIVDITHSIRRHNLRQAAFALLNAYKYFPPGTVHLVVVDPGVGTARRAIAVKSKRCFFVAPDNGVLSYALEQDNGVEIVSIENRAYMLSEISITFHGRDIFAPISAHLSLGIEIEKLGPKITDPVSLEKSVPVKISACEIIGHVIYIDLFGNCITDVAESHITELTGKGLPNRIKIKVRDKEISKISQTYCGGKENELICLFGSSGHLEFSINKGNANKQFTIEEGGEFILKAL